MSITQRTLRVLLTFVVQFSRSYALFWDYRPPLSQPPFLSSAFAIIHHPKHFVKNFFEIFSNFPDLHGGVWSALLSIVVIIIQDYPKVNLFFPVFFISTFLLKIPLSVCFLYTKRFSYPLFHILFSKTRWLFVICTISPCCSLAGLYKVFLFEKILLDFFWNCVII